VQGRAGGPLWSRLVGTAATLDPSADVLLLSQAGLLQSSYLTVKYPQRAFLSAGSALRYLGIRNILESVRAGIYQLPPTPMQGGYIFSYTLEQALAQNPADAPNPAWLPPEMQRK
jgi:hypothetical protein